MNSSYWPINTAHQRPSLVTQLASVWHGILAHLNATNEPHVWPATDDSGATLWNAYDPLTQLTINHASDDELRVWLEELHYRN
ncbi:hypothetical protein [Nodosilinea sp. E11]|uniref:hypothetical protein n=1 Tax=Nodosilinea sp. E11 TaxID=3037479 RepID=UPI0029346E97|nr:hypothetical protein [Nodosilinea sp. E11]WOD37599.1 hypothetical protein RRF56_15430 [Nodosilinea sp. E11]